MFASASSAVTSWYQYDSIYTERYMGIPQENKDGYEAGSALKYVDALKGRLMIYYGTADNNVHPTNAMQLIQALQRAGMANLALGSAPGSRVMATKDIVLPRANTVLWALSDVFVIPPPGPVRTIFSVGDLCLVAGVFILFQRVMCRRSPAPQSETQGGQSRAFLR